MDPELIERFRARLAAAMRRQGQGFHGSPADRAIDALGPEVIQPASRAVQRLVRGDGMSGDVTLQNLGSTRPARAAQRMGGLVDRAMRSGGNFAQRAEPEMRRFFSGLLR